MLTKERLEELMKNNGKIYHIVEFNGECAVKKNEVVDFNAVDLLYSLMNGDKNELFETKEDAEFALKYRNIARTETLSLPTWEEFEQKSYFDFIASDGRNIIIEQTLLVDFEEEDCLSNFNLVVSDWNDYSHKALFRGDYTKESYTKACELCRKLFLGEEIKC